MIGKLIMGIMLIIGSITLVPESLPNSLIYHFLGWDRPRQIAGIIMGLIGFILCAWYVADTEAWPKRREKRGAIRCPKCGREMRLSGNYPNYNPPCVWWCGTCDYNVDILPDKFKKKRQEARKQLERQGFTFAYGRTSGGGEIYDKKGYEASLDWAGNIHIFDLELEEEL